MTEKLYETLSNKLLHLRHVHGRKLNINLNRRIKKPSFPQKFHPKIQNLIDVHRFRKETNHGTCYPAQLQKIHKIMFHDVIIDTKKAILCVT
jgi:hypothetical protein